MLLVLFLVLIAISNEQSRYYLEHVFAEVSTYLATAAAATTTASMDTAATTTRHLLQQIGCGSLVLIIWAYIVVSQTHSKSRAKWTTMAATSGVVGIVAMTTRAVPSPPVVLVGMVDFLVESPLLSLAILLVGTKIIFDACFTVPIPSLTVPLHDAEAATGYEYFGKPHPEMNLQDPATPGFIQCYDPATAQKIGTVPIVTPTQVQERVDKAKRAQKAWATSSFEQRRHVLRIMLKFILEHQQDIVRLAVRDSGKTELGASFGEVLPSCEKIQWVIDNGEQVLSKQERSAARIMIYKSAWVEYCPLGVLGVISPFNYPFHNFINHIISGLFAGNSVVCKVSEHTSWSANYFHRFVSAALAEARDSGVVPMASPDLVQVITGFGESGAALVSSGVDKIIFTGSTKVGRLVMQGASKHNLTPCVLELGGKDPFIVLEDADVDSVFKLLMRGVFQNCGQNCIGVERVYVHAKLHDEFVKKAVSKVSRLRQGAPLSGTTCDLGATTMPDQLRIIETLVNDAVEKGATVAIGGQRNTKAGQGLFYEPTVLINVTHAMKIAKEEVFGPVMVIMKFNTDDELLALANDSDFGLCSSVWSKDVHKANAIVSQLHVGMSNINDYGVNYLVQSLPFGGVKLSGYGRFGGVEGLRECCAMKSVTKDASSLITTAAMMPPVLDYPVGDTAVPFNEGLLAMTYGNGLVRKLSGLMQLLGSLICTAKGKKKEE